MITFVHGASGNARTWEPVIAGLSGTRAVDLPGRGGSPGDPCQTALDAAGWLAGQLDGDVLVGHSFGGAVALQVALTAPERIRALVLVSSAGRLRVHPAILAAVGAATVDAPYRLDAAFGPDTPPAVIERYAADAATTPPATALVDWQACDRFDVLGLLDQVRVPTLVLHGDADALTVPKHQVALARAIPGAGRTAIEGAGHMLPWERPRAFIAALQVWLRTNLTVAEEAPAWVTRDVDVE